MKKKRLLTTISGFLSQTIALAIFVLAIIYVLNSVKGPKGELISPSIGFLGVVYLAIGIAFILVGVAIGFMGLIEYSIAKYDNETYHEKIKRTINYAIFILLIAIITCVFAFLYPKLQIPLFILGGVCFLVSVLLSTDIILFYKKSKQINNNLK